MKEPTAIEPPAAARLQAAATLVAALQRQLGARLVETHISWVLLGEELAWKIKKPVRLPFLDFSTLAARQRLCAEELRLNRRLAPSLYLGVDAITGSAAEPRLGGDGPVIEVALRMRRFPDGALLSERLAAGRLEPALLDRLAARLSAFHRDAAVVPTGEPYGMPARIHADMLGVLEGLRGEGEAVEALQRWAADEAKGLHDTWMRRRRDGWVREGHGDLHLANTVAFDDTVTAFDCIEFDPALRRIDVQCDIAFLVMDLLAHGRRDLAFRFLDHYLAAGGDHGGLAVLRYYVVYRALVRAMVARLRPPAGDPDYLALARRWQQPPGARLLVTHGLSGSGKSHVAERLLERAGAIRLRSDVERKRLHGLAALQASASPVGGGIYDADSSRRTYARLLELADGALRGGWPVIVDATFLRAAVRQSFRDLARRLAVPFSILHCRAPDEVLQQRLNERRGDVSEADAAVLERQRALQDPLRGDEAAEVLLVEAGTALDVDPLAARWASLRGGADA